MVLNRFLKYVQVETTSDEESSTVPSSFKEKDLGTLLAKELLDLGIKDAHMDEYGYVYGHLPATPGREKDPVLALIAHMDTSPAASGYHVTPRIVHYTGGDLPLNDTVSITLDLCPVLKEFQGQDLIVTDGTTLLGADDKAGVAEIMELCEILLQHPEYSHPGLAICFTPDEEIGRGPDYLDLQKLGATYGYTVDGGILGGIEYENFNAASCKVTFHGINIHPGAAKGIMKNATLMVAEYISKLPKEEQPSTTEGYEGFYHVTSIKGDECEATVSMIIRDHDKTKFEKKKAHAKEWAEEVAASFGVTCTVDLQDSYYNMREYVEPYPFLIDSAKRAMEKCGVEPRIEPIRGGTDGARLSYEGLPCPNLSTGGFNYHSVRECIPVESLQTMVDVLRHLVSYNMN